LGPKSQRQQPDAFGNYSGFSRQTLRAYREQNHTDDDQHDDGCRLQLRAEQRKERIRSAPHKLSINDDQKTLTLKTEDGAHVYPGRNDTRVKSDRVSHDMIHLPLTAQHTSQNGKPQLPRTTERQKFGRSMRLRTLFSWSFLNGFASQCISRIVRFSSTKLPGRQQA
jgi:hypothetical protein